MEADSWINIARSHFKDGEYEEALVAIEEALRLDLANYGAWFIKGAALRRLRRYEEALEAFEEASDLKPEEIDAWIGKGLVLHSLKRDEEALDAFGEALKINQEDFAARLGKASAYLTLKKYEEALKAYDKVIEINQNWFTVWLNRGIVLGNLGKHTDAIDSFDKAIELDDPYCYLALAAKAEALINLKKYRDASVTYKKLLKESQKAVKENSQDSLAWRSKGFSLAHFRRYEESLKAFNRAIEIKMQDSGIWNDIGVTRFNLGRYEEAKEAYVKAIEIKPDAESPYVNLGELFLHLGSTENASKYVEKALEINKMCVNALALKGRVRIEEGEYDGAAKLFKEAISFDPGNLGLLLWDIYAQYLSTEFSLHVENGGSIRTPENVRGKKYLDKMYEIMRETKYQEEITSITRKLERVLNLSEKQRDLREFILYYLGYFYYKGNDIFRAKKRLEECIILESRRMKLWEFIRSGSWKDELSIFIITKSKWEKFKRFITAKSPMEREARELLNCIWMCKIRPTWWTWWCSSPVHRWLKRSIFILLLCSILSAILYSFIPESANKSIYVVILVSIFVLLSPSMQSMKAPGVEVELHLPPPLEPMLSPIRMEEGMERFWGLSI